MAISAPITSVRQEVVLQDPELFGGRSYYIRVPDIYDQAELRRRIKARGGKALDQSVMAAKLRRGIEAVFRDQGEIEEADQYLKVLDDLIERADAMAGFSNVGEAVPDELIAEINALSEDADEIATVVARAYAPYAAALADADYWQDLMKIEMIRMFLTRIDERHDPEPVERPLLGSPERVPLGEESPPIECPTVRTLWRAKREGRVKLLPIEALPDIPPAHLARVQMEIMGLFAPDEAQIKN